MIFGLADPGYIDDDDNNTPEEANPLDTQIETLKKEIKALEKEIQTKEAAKFIEDDVTKERKQRELADLEKQVINLTRADEHEQTRITHYQNEITRRESKQPVPLPPDTTDETIVAINQQNEALQAELNKIYADLAAEVGKDFDVDKILKTKGSAKKRAEELQALQATVSKAQATYIDARRLDEINEAGRKASRGLDTLLAQKNQLEDSISEMKTGIRKARRRVDSLEEESRALRMMDVLLTEKLAHDADLIKHLKQLKDEETGELPEPEVPPVTLETIAQLRAQQAIVRGLGWKLAEYQKELSRATVPSAFGFMAEQLAQINSRCVDLLQQFVAREAAVTDEIETHVEDTDDEEDME